MKHAPSRPTPHSPDWARIAVVAALAVGIVAQSQAQISGGQVLAGAATIQQQGPVTTIQAGDRSILRWDQFNVGAPETVRFVQPGPDARVLNYIGSTAPSRIDGHLLANGQVYLMNPYGIYFGGTAVVETAGLFAVAGHMSREDFLAGVNRFSGIRGDVINQGTIAANAVALVGQTVANSGSIVAPDGFVGLAAGDEVFLGERGGRIYVNAGRTAPPVNPEAAGVSNTGTISAPRGRVVLAAGDLYSVAIRNDGVVSGRDIALQGQGSGTVLNSGRVDASTSEAGTAGGRIEMTGENVAIMDGAVLDASGAAGGGTVLIGGDFQGGNSAIRNADVTVVAPGATLRSDATTEGNGGNIIVWSNGTTRFHGELSARGAGARGAGGWAEVSGLKLLDFNGGVDLRASSGQTGMLLLDPTNIFIAANQAAATAAGMGGTDTSAGDGGPTTFQATNNVSDSLLLTSTLTTALANATVLVTTTNLGGTGLGNITVVSPIAWSASTGLNLTANNTIAVNAPISAAGSNIVLTAGSNVTITNSISTGGSLTINQTGTLTSTTALTANSISLLGSGPVGAAATPVNIAAPNLTISKTGGATYVSRGSNPLQLSVTGMPAGGAITAGNVTLTSALNAGNSTLALNTAALSLGNFTVLGGSVTLNNSGALTGSGTITASTVNLTGGGAVGASGAGNVITVDSSQLIINKSAGAVFVRNPSNSAAPLRLNGTNMPAGGEVTGTSVTLIGHLNAGTSSLTLNGGFIDLDGFNVTAGTVTFNATSNLEGRNNGAGVDGIVTANSITILGTGHAWFDQPILTRTGTLIFNKPADGVGEGTYVQITNYRDGGVTASGSILGFDSRLKLISLDAAGGAFAPLTVGSGGLNVPGNFSFVWIESSQLTLSGGITSPAIYLYNRGAVTGTGILTASEVVHLFDVGAVGTAGAAININTPLLEIFKDAGAVYVNNGANPLMVEATGDGQGMLGGGVITAGNVVVTALEAGSSNVTLNTAALSVTNDGINAGNVTINNSGTFTSSATIDALSLTLTGAGTVGNFTGNTTSIPTNISSLSLAKSAGATLISNSGLLSVSGSTGNGDVNISAGGAITIPSALSVGSGTLRLRSVGGINQASGTITAASFSARNAASGNIVLPSANAIGTFAANNDTTGFITVRSDASSFIIGNVSAVGSSFPAVTNLTTGVVDFFSGGNISISDTLGSIQVNRPVSTAGTGNGTVNISGAVTVNATLTAAANTTITIAGVVTPPPPQPPPPQPPPPQPPPIDLSSDTIINVPLTTGNASITAARDVILNAPVIATSTGGLSIIADSDLNGTGGVLFTGNGFLTANALTAPLTISGSSIVNAGSFGGAGLGVGNALYIQSGGAMNTVQPVNITLQPSAPSGAGIVINGGNSFPAISTNSNTVTFGPGSGTVTLNGVSLTTPLLSSTGPVNFSTHPVILAGNTRIVASSTVFGSTVNGAFGLSLSNNATFNGTGGGTTPLASLQVGGNATLNATVTTSGSQTYNGSLSGTGTAAASSIILTGGGQVIASEAGNAFALNTPSLTINKTAGAVFVTNGNNPLSLAANTMPAGGAITAGNLTLSAPVGAGTSALTLTASGSLALGSNAITAGNVTLNNSGALTGSGAVAASETVFLTGNGTVGSSGSGNAIEVRTPSLVVNKSAGSVYANTGGGNVSLSAPLFAGGEFTAANLALSGPVNAGSGALILNTAGTFGLGNNSITAGTLTINNAQALTGTSTLAASQLELRGPGDIGSASGAIETKTSAINFGKTGGNSFIANEGALSVSGTTGNGSVGILANALVVSGNLSLGSGTLRLVTTGGISQSANSVITADSLSLLNRTSGNVTLGGANVIRLFAGQNTAPAGSMEARSDVAAGSFVGSIAGVSLVFPAVSGVSTQGGDITITNRAGAVNVDQVTRSVGGGVGTVNIAGAIVNAEVAAAGNSTVTITGNAIISPDTIINSAITSGNTTFSATRDIIINAPLTATSVGGLALTADSDNSGTGGILVTSRGSVVANSLTAPLVLRGSSVVNADGIGGAGLGVGNLLHIQSGGSILTVQPVMVTAQTSAPASAGLVLNGNTTTLATGANPAIATSGGGISFTVPGPILLNGGSLTTPLLSSTGAVTFASNPISVTGDTRIAATSTTFNGSINGSSGLSLSGAASFAVAIGGVTPLGSLAVGGPLALDVNISTTGAQSYAGAVTLSNNITLTTSNGNVTFGSTVNSANATARNLTVTAGTGAITFNGVVGGTNTLNALVLNSAGTTRLSGLTVTSLTTDAPGSTVVAGQITAGSVTINDPLAIESGGISTTGNQTYGGAVQLRANARFASSGGSIAFRSTVLPDSATANRTFEAAAAAGNITAAGDIGADANRFGSVQVSGRNIAVTNVFSAGALGLAMGSGANEVLEISGTRISSSSGNVTLGSTPARTAAPTRASINKGNAGDLAIDGNRVVFQPFERTSISAGNLTVTGRNSVILSTTAVSGRLIVTTPSLSIYQRSPSSVDLGTTLGVDTGTDIVASDVDFAIARDANGVATVPLIGVQPASAFATIPLGNTTASGGVTIATLNPPVNAPDSPAVRYLNLRAAGFAGPTIEPTRFGATTPLLSLVAQGSTAGTFQQIFSNTLPPTFASGVIHLGNDVTGDEDDANGPAVPLEKLSPPLVDVELSGALREQLQNLGVFARRLTPEERIARLRSLPFYDQVPRKTDVRDRDYEVVDARVSRESAVEAVAEWQRQFINPTTNQSRVPEIAAALGQAFDAYRETSTSVDPVAFRRWLEARGGDAGMAPALGFVREVGALFQRLESLGLTRTELEVSKTQILFRVLQDAPSMRAGFLRRVLEADEPVPSRSATTGQPASTSRT